MMNAVWSAQPGPQNDAISATWCDELLFGGARGGGKTDFLLGDFLQDVKQYGKAWQGVLFRRSTPELDEVKKRAHQIYPQTGAKWQEQKSQWVWPNGAMLKFRHLERQEDAEKYRGHSYTWIGWDELTQWSSDYVYNVLKACLRSSYQVGEKRIRATANPGGVGHQWVKEYFVDPYPLGSKPIDDEVSMMTRMFIKSKVTDNKILMANDPQYIGRLKAVGSPELVRAWLEGDWSIVTGAFFPEFKVTTHVVAPCKLPRDWTRFRALDWGFAAPFCVLWFAVSDGTMDEFPKNALIVYREWYGKSGPNKGIRLPANQVAQGILARDGQDTINYTVIDPACWKQDSGPSIAEEFRKTGVSARPADNARVSGWNQVRQRLLGDDSPGLYIFSSCAELIRTFPLQQHDENKPEDLDTTGEDHALDTLRYGCMSRPYATITSKPVAKLRNHKQITLNELWEKGRPVKVQERY